MATKAKSALKTKTSRQYHDVIDSNLNLTDTTSQTVTSAVTVDGEVSVGGEKFNKNYCPARGYDRYYLEEYFAQLPGINGDLASTTEATNTPVNRNFEILGTNGTSALATFDHDHTGATLTTDAADNDSMIIVPHLDTKQSSWGVAGQFDSQKSVEWSTAITTGAAITTTGIWAGLKLTNTPVYATDTDQIYFIYDATDDSGALTTNANLHVVHSIAGADHITDLGIAVAVNTTYHLHIKIAADRTATVYVDGTQYSLTSATTAGGVATGAGTVASAALTTNKPLIPYIGVIARAGSAARALRVHNQKISVAI
jgi:hypothetical protein